MEEPARATPTLVRVTLALVFACIVIKAASSDLTWDEAWTYLFYGRSPFGFTRLDYANDHPLNSILIWASTRIFGNSEFIIRVPNILAGALYLFSTAKLIGAVRVKLFAFALCVMQPYLLDYFALARGYGIAAALVQWGLVAHFFGGRPRPVMMLTACLLASLAVFSTVVVLYALIAALTAAALLRQSEHGLTFSWPLRIKSGMTGASLTPSWPGLTRPSVAAGRRRGVMPGSSPGVTDAAAQLKNAAEPARPVLIGFSLLGVIPVVGLLRVSREGLPLYGSAAGFFDAIVRGVARMYAPNAWSTAVAVAILLSVAGLLLAEARVMSRRAAALTLASAGVLAATWVAARVGGKPLPTGRLLLPFLPLWSLAAIAMAEDIRAASGRLGRPAMASAGVVLCVLLGVAFLRGLHFQRYADWPQDYRLQNRLAQALAVGGKCLPMDVWERYGHVYYLDRWFPPDRRPADVPCPSPSK